MNNSSEAFRVPKQPDIRIGSSSSTLWGRIVRYRYLYLITLPGFIYLLLFKFVPLWGLILSFQNYNPFVGMWASEWVGFKNFADLFGNPNFYLMLRNTLLINLFGLVFYFPAPILLALMLNEVRNDRLKKVHQSIVYLPHFLSWVIIASMTFFVLSVDVGLLNKIIHYFGYEPIKFLTNKKLFWGLLTVQTIWKQAGWGTIIFLAAMAAVDPTHYEAAVVDGASRFRQIWHITLPAIRPTIVVLLILRLGHMADVGFEQILLMLNPLVREAGEVFDTYTYTQGILQGQLSVGISVGFFKGLVGLAFVVTSNYVVKKLGYEAIY